jgi:hypothetical protein
VAEYVDKCRETWWRGKYCYNDKISKTENIMGEVDELVRTITYISKSNCYSIIVPIFKIAIDNNNKYINNQVLY